MNRLSFLKSLFVAPLAALFIENKCEANTEIRNRSIIELVEAFQKEEYRDLIIRQVILRREKQLENLGLFFEKGLES